MTPTAPTTRTTPRIRTLVWLALALLLVHGLVLRTVPTHFGPTLTPKAASTAAFVTRSIPAAPPAATVLATAPTATQAKPKPKRKQAPLLQQKELETPEVPYSQEPSAIDLIKYLASETTEPEPESEPESGHEPSTTDTASEQAPDAVAASSAPTAELPALPALPALVPELPQTLATTFKFPSNARLSYQVRGNAKGFTYHASAELNWLHALSHYDASMTVSALFIGSRRMTSSGQIVAEGLAPTRFADKYKNEVSANFEPDKGQVSFSANTPTLPWIKGMQDRVSVFFQLAGMLAGQPESFPVGSVISMVTVGPRDADGWSFLVEAAEKISLPAGQMDTLKLARQPRKENDQTVEIWYAPALGYLPVRSKITEPNGDFFDQQLTQVDQLAP